MIKPLNQYAVCPSTTFECRCGHRTTWFATVLWRYYNEQNKNCKTGRQRNSASFHSPFKVSFFRIVSDSYCIGHLKKSITNVHYGWESCHSWIVITDNKVLVYHIFPRFRYLELRRMGPIEQKKDTLTQISQRNMPQITILCLRTILTVITSAFVFFMAV